MEGSIMPGVVEKKDMKKKTGSVEGTTAAQVRADFAAKTPEEKGALGHIVAPPEGEPTFALGTPGGAELPIAPIAAEGTTDTTTNEDIVEETIDGDKIPVLNVAGTVKPFELPASEPSIAALYRYLNPEPKQRTPEEQEKYERQRKASSIILGVVDAVNGLSNLGATIYGAPSRNDTPIVSKWREALDAAENARQQRIDTWREGLLKSSLEDFKRSRTLADAKAAEERSAREYDRRTAQELKNSKELSAYKADLDKNAREHAAGLAATQEGNRHANEMAEIAARNAGSGASGTKPRKEQFSATINGTTVDVYLRSAEDVHPLYKILAKEVESNSPKGSSELKELEELVKALSGETVDASIAATKKKDFIRDYFAEYYPKIKNKPEYEHLNVEFRNNKGELITFVDSPASPQTYGDVEAHLRGSSTPQDGLLNQNLGDRPTTSNNNEVITLSFVNI